MGGSIRSIRQANNNHNKNIPTGLECHFLSALRINPREESHTQKRR